MTLTSSAERFSFPPMRCSHCQTENPADSRFCEACGQPIEPVCPSCGASNRPGARFCRQCGTGIVESRKSTVEKPLSTPLTPRPLDSSTTAPPAYRSQADSPQTYTPRHLAEKILNSRSALEGERKQVTVLFADVKESMQLSEQVDPEEWHRIMDRFFAILTEGVHRFEGTVNQYTGDGIMALFGAPIAHEDHGQRACYAALRLRDGLRRYADELRRGMGLSFLVRIGIHSGDVVVGKIGDDLRMDYTAQGHTVGLAARMEQLAEPGKPLLTEHTAQLVRGYFKLHDLGEATVKGVSAPLKLYELEDVGDLRTRFDVSRSRGLTRFVGRDAEMQVLEDALAHSLSGGGRVVSIVADAGTGKSRLCFEFAQRCRSRGIVVNETVCLAHGKTIPFLPLLALFRQAFGIRSQDRPDSVRQKIAGTLALLDPGLQETLPLWFEFLGVPDPLRPLSRLDPDARQRKFVSAIRRFVRARSLTGPAVLILEDLQWADAASEALVQSFIAILAESQTLLVLNYRPEYRAVWVATNFEADTPEAFFRTIHLTPLQATAVQELLDDLIGTDPSLSDMRALLEERTAGNPFFLEEVVRSLYAEGTLVNSAAKGSRPKARLTRTVREIRIPATVRAVLAARIDRLSAPEKEVLQTAAVIGKEFSEPLIRRVVATEGSIQDLDGILSALQTAEFIVEQAIYPEAEYAFHHPLTHHVAYYAQLHDRRARIHAAIARALVETYPDELDVRAALIAHHWEGADQPLEAARWNRKAAEWLTRSDPSEAQHNWQKVRELTLAQLPSPERDALLLDASTQIITLGVRLGLAETDAQQVFEDARVAGEAHEDRRHLAQLHNAYGMFNGMLGRGELAVQSIMEAERYAAEIGDREMQLSVRVTVAVWLLHRGQLADALQLIQQGIDLADGDLSLGADIVGFSPLAFLTLYRGTTHTAMGDLGEARKDLQTALDMARRNDESEIECMALGFLSIVTFYEGERDATLAYARQTAQVATRIGSPFILGFANGIVGAAHRMREEWDEAAALIHAELAITRERGTGLLVEAVSIANLAEVYLGQGNLPKALQTAEEAVAVARLRGSRIFECDSLLAQFDVLLRFADAASQSKAEAALNAAAAIVDETGAHSRTPLLWEKRAALARARGNTTAAAQALEEAKLAYERMHAKGHVARLVSIKVPSPFVRRGSTALL
ncbi:MAG: AAA family ATPase [Deltaproteobacteria bacterium]|nr:AAA family ATPase [Deltaproteobacteria bacterium]